MRGISVPIYWNKLSIADIVDDGHYSRKMKRIIGFALLAALTVVAFAFLFQNIQPEWYGNLLCQACLIFGSFGLVAGFACGFLARQAPTSLTVVRNTQAMANPTRTGTAKAAQSAASKDSRFISSPVAEVSEDRWGDTARVTPGKNANQQAGRGQRGASR